MRFDPKLGRPERLVRIRMLLARNHKYLPLWHGPDIWPKEFLDKFKGEMVPLEFPPPSDDFIA